jgi:hypothetical protein
MKDNEFDRAEMELYMLTKKYPGCISGISGHMKKNDSSKLSRQLNPSDERLDNPIIESLKILKGACKFSPELETEIWTIMERERSKNCRDGGSLRAQLAELLFKIHTELGDVVYKHSVGAPKADLEKEGFELFQAVKNFYEKIKQSEGE